MHDNKLSPLPQAQEVPTTKTTEQLFDEISKMCDEVYHNKNSDYGNAVDVTYALFGKQAILVRLWDKMLRLTQLALTNTKNVDESFLDTILDLRNYAQIGAAQVTNPDQLTLEDAFGIYQNILDSKKQG